MKKRESGVIFTPGGIAPLGTCLIGVSVARPKTTCMKIIAGEKARGKYFHIGSMAWLKELQIAGS